MIDELNEISLQKKEHLDYFAAMGWDNFPVPPGINEDKATARERQVTNELWVMLVIECVLDRYKSCTRRGRAKVRGSL